MSEVVLITGGARRLGRMMARILSRKGYRVVVHYHTSEAAARELERTHGVKTVRGDLSVPGAVEPLFREALTAYGVIDHVVNNASRFERGTIGELTLEAYQRMMNLHATAPLFLSQALYRHLLERGRTGSIINIVDAGVSKPTASRVGYYLSKGALLEQTKVLAVAFGPTLRVNALSPGAVLSTEDDEGYFGRMQRILPLGRTGTAEAVAEGVLYLLEADFVSGIELPIDGGQKLL
ncbi:MAG: SDR family oxidoreductase [Spirochaetales bacterium]|nr:SDR family oxidoreductase [Spirochaetales bacterium]